MRTEKTHGESQVGFADSTPWLEPVGDGSGAKPTAQPGNVAF